MERLFDNGRRCFWLAAYGSDGGLLGSFSEQIPPRDAAVTETGRLVPGWHLLSSRRVPVTNGSRWPALISYLPNSPILTIRPNSLRCRRFSLLADAVQVGLDRQPATLDGNGTRSNLRHLRLGTILQLPPQMQKDSDFAGVTSEFFYTHKC